MHERPFVSLIDQLGKGAYGQTLGDGHFKTSIIGNTRGADLSVKDGIDAGRAAQVDRLPRDRVYSVWTSATEQEEGRAHPPEGQEAARTRAAPESKGKRSEAAAIVVI